MKFEDALVAARLGRGMLFTGSGFSLGAENQHGEKLPKTSKLSELLVQAAGRDDDVPFDVAADLYRRKFRNHPTALSEFLRDLFSVSKITSAQLAISKEPWRRIYTTNYDNVVEVGAERAGIIRRAISVACPPSDFDQDDAWVVHLHGFPEELNGRNAVSPILLSRISYVDAELMRTKWPTQFQTDLFRAAAVIVVGFSFSDLHIARLFRETASVRRKTFIVVQPDADEALVEAAEEFGTVVKIGTDGLAEALAKVDVSLVPTELTVPIVSFERFELPNAVPPKPEDVWNLLAAGTFRPECHLNALIDPTAPYSFSRNYGLRTIAEWTGEGRKVVLTSRIGNGKSIFLQQLNVTLARDGFIVLNGQRPSEAISEEIAALRKDDKPLAFLFEDAREHEVAIGAVLEQLRARDILIVTTRSSGTASQQSRLRDLLGADAKRVDLDRLEAADLKQLDSLLAYYGLWPEAAGETEQARRKFVEDECAGEVRGVLLHVFQNPAITARIRQPIDRLGGNRNAEAVLTCMLASRLANTALTFSDICDIFNFDRREIHAAFEESGVRDLVPDTDDNFRARSPVLAEHILQHVLAPSAVYDSLKLLLARVVDFREADTRYVEALPALLRFAFVTRVFRGKSSRELILSYYESALTFGVVQEDPQFWLQLAMARIEFLDWEPAGTALATAYKKAKRLPAYLTFMIDNQKARFLLMSANDGYPGDRDESAKEACSIIQSRLVVRQGEVDVYAFRVIYPLITFLDKFSASLHPNTITLIRATLRQAASVLRQAQQSRMLSSEEERARRTLSARRLGK